MPIAFLQFQKDTIMRNCNYACFPMFTVFRDMMSSLSTAKQKTERTEGKILLQETKKKMLEVTKNQNGALIYGFSPADPYVRSARRSSDDPQCGKSRQS